MDQQRIPGNRSGRGKARFAAMLFAVAALVCGSAQAGVQTTVNGNTATSTISLSGIEADLTLSFSEVDNLSVSVLGVDAVKLGLLDILRLLQRLTGLNLSAVLNAFPVLITIEPADGLVFANTVRVELHTHNLVYAPGTRLRLFKSENGGPFFDITEAVEAGSVRARGRTGGFSQFMVLQDLRSTRTVITDKYNRLAIRLDDAAGHLPATQMQSLADLLAASRAFSEQGDQAAAIASLDVFDAEVRQLSGGALPNLWSSSGGLDNIGGDLQAGAATLRFSLGYLRDHGN